jgi:hypothetical protein
MLGGLFKWVLILALIVIGFFIISKFPAEVMIIIGAVAILYLGKMLMQSNNN